MFASPIQASVWPLQLADQFANGVQIGQRLAGVAKVGQAVDDRASAMLGDFDHGLVAVGANHDHVGVLAQDAGEIGDALAPAETGLIAQEHRTAAKMGHARLEAHARPQRWLLEQQGHHSPRQQRFAPPLLVLALQIVA